MDEQPTVVVDSEFSFWPEPANWELDFPAFAGCRVEYIWVITRYFEETALVQPIRFFIRSFLLGGQRGSQFTSNVTIPRFRISLLGTTGVLTIIECLYVRARRVQ